MVQHVGVDAQQVQIPAHQQRTLVGHHPLFVMRDGSLDESGQGVPAGKSVESLAQAVGVGSGEVAGSPSAEDGHRPLLLPLEIFGTAAIPGHQRQRLSRDAACLLLETACHSVEFPAESSNPPLVGQDDRLAAHLEQERFVEKMPGHLLERSCYTPVLPLLHQVIGIILEPLQQRGALRVFEGIKHLVDHLREDGRVIEFHAIGGVLADFPGERPHHGLEELVDGADREAGVVVQEESQPFCGQRGLRIIAARELV